MESYPREVTDLAVGHTLDRVKFRRGLPPARWHVGVLLRGANRVPPPVGSVTRSALAQDTTASGLPSTHHGGASGVTMREPEFPCASRNETAATNARRRRARVPTRRARTPTPRFAISGGCRAAYGAPRRIQRSAWVRAVTARATRALRYLGTSRRWCRTHISDDNISRNATAAFLPGKTAVVPDWPMRRPPRMQSTQPHPNRERPPLSSGASWAGPFGKKDTPDGARNIP
jgi:hypothetical protein